MSNKYKISLDHVSFNIHDLPGTQSDFNGTVHIPNVIFKNFVREVRETDANIDGRDLIRIRAHEVQYGDVIMGSMVTERSNSHRFGLWTTIHLENGGILKFYSKTPIDVERPIQ